MNKFISNEIANLIESEEFEFKIAQSKHGLGELLADFWKSYSAMANTYGEQIFLGIREKSGKFIIAGIENIEKVKTDLSNLLNNRDHISVNFLTHKKSIQTVIIDDKQFWDITVPQANRKQKLVHLTKNPLGHSYIRI